ncbi:HTH-type transcriptional regulator KipR [Meiothermus granaticius NBRC 107808]|uniref:HTH-type transcriptional regulator KipR n=2 Tax=Meiothermus TaxID=65551 RepID=A0A399FE18_9DEIN|nr:HTH-type transcriptional regulator KipR [Meiothermus granaticius NBRC 107808]
MVSQSQNQYVMNSSYRTLQVLLAFAAPPHRFTLTEVTQRMGLEKNQVYRSLKTLEEAGFLRTDADGRFSLTPILGVLAAASAGNRPSSLVDVAAPFMDRLAAETGESVNLFVLVGEFAVCVDRRDSTQRVRVASVLGQSIPLHVGAVPKAILANLPEAEQERILNRLPSYPRYTERTVMEPAKLRRELAQIRERGYSVSDGDFDLAARGVGAAIFDQGGQVTGGISVGGPEFRVDDATLGRFAELIVQVARAISRQLGYPI